MAEEKITTDNKQQTTDELKILKLEMEKCKKEAEEYLNGWKRAKADYLNLKNQAGEAQKDLVRFANLGMILNFLPIYDGLKRACKEAPSTRFVEASARQAGSDNNEKSEGWSEGILNIKKQFECSLKNLDIEEIKTVGEEFNPELHEAVAKEKREGFGSDIVLKEVGGGYKLAGRVIVAAKVVVSE